MNKQLLNVLIIVFVIFVTWFITRHVYTHRILEAFTTNFNPDANGMEQTIRGYAYAFGDNRDDSSVYFGFKDDLASLFSKRLLPDIIPKELPKTKS
jgi:hypothetical protein